MRPIITSKDRLSWSDVYSSPVLNLPFAVPLIHYLPVDQDLNLSHDNFRNHKDKNENSYGRLLSDLTGIFTCFAYNGNSTVDLVIAPNTVKQKVDNTLKFYPLLNGQIIVC